MGTSSRERPQRLAEKLKRIRITLGLSQDGMLIRLGHRGQTIKRNAISAYELSKREPPLLILYSYANAANIYLEVLVDDAIDLPDIIPAAEKSLGKRKRR